MLGSISSSGRSFFLRTAIGGATQKTAGALFWTRFGSGADHDDAGVPGVWESVTGLQDSPASELLWNRVFSSAVVARGRRSDPNNSAIIVTICYGLIT